MIKLFKNYISKLNLELIFAEILNKIFALLILLIFFYISKKIIHISVQRIVAPSLKLSQNEVNRQKTITRLVENSLNYALYFFLIYWLLSIFGLPVSSLLAGAGIAGVAVGLGAQGFLSDLVNGFFILLERQFDVGDTVSLSNSSLKISGKIASMGIRTTQVRDADGTLHFVPNRNITVVSNQSRGDMRAQIDLPLYANTDLEMVANVIQEVNLRELENYPEVVSQPLILGPQTSATGQFFFRVNLFTESGQQTKIYHIFYQLYQEALLEVGIEFPTMAAVTPSIK